MIEFVKLFFTDVIIFVAGVTMIMMTIIFRELIKVMREW